MEGRLPRRIRGGLLAVGIPALAIAFGVLSIALPQHGRSIITSLTQLSPLLLGVNVVTGLAVIAAGVAAWLFDRRGAGLAAMLAGATWFGADWAASVGAPDLVRAIGVWATTLTLPLAVGVALFAIQSGTLALRTRVTVGLVLALGTLTALWLVAWVPALDPRCLAICDTNPLGLGVDYRLARALANAWQGMTVVVAGCLAVWAGVRLRRATGPARHRDRLILLSAVGVGVAWALWAGTLLAPSTPVPPAGSIAVIAFAGRAVALTILAAGLVLRVVAEQRTLIAVRRLAEHLSPLPGGGTLRTALARAFGDPDLQLLYALPDGAGLVDDDGRPIDPGAGPFLQGRATWIQHGPETVAVAIHAPVGDDSLEPELGPAVRLAADNERLLASVRHEMLSVRESRARIVDEGDRERHRLERDLHDGAQQRMLGVLQELSTARSTAAREGDAAAVAAIDLAVGVARETLDALRRLARGLHQSVLTEAGLAAALEALADEAPIPVAIDAPDDARYAPSTEAAAWRLATRVIGAAHRGGATDVLVRVRERDQRLAVTVAISGLGEGPELVGLTDQVGAAGGRLASSWTDEGTLTIVADLPCG